MVKVLSTLGDGKGMLLLVLHSTGSRYDSRWHRGDPSDAKSTECNLKQLKVNF